MEVNEDKSAVSHSKNNSNDSNTITNEALSETSLNDEQNIEKSLTEDTSNFFKNEVCQQKAQCFKKPLLMIGPKRGKSGKVRLVDDLISSSCESSAPSEKVTESYIPSIITDNTDEPISENVARENIVSDTKSISVPYLEPVWSGKPEEEYKLEVLKSGVILETININEKSFYVVGRLPVCDLSLAHPTISRYHAIIQYRSTGDEQNPKGFYLYDLESTHGTFWNGHRIKPRIYVRLRGGHMIRFGCSQRKYIVQAPPDDQEEESELSVTQLKEKRLMEQEIKQREQEEEAGKAEEEDGIDWGLGEDADEETDLTENPYASMADEELYLDDPKKTLRGWFEREGYDLQYQVEEKGIGQFLCWVTLPKECFGGRSIKAEALVKGKKKESVIQCALEACRILDRHGLLRQANHEARKKKSRNWEEEDYYDSDEDNFLDRTGTIEKKREHRMQLAGKLEKKVETYSTLTEQHTQIVKQILCLNNRLKEAQESHAKMNESTEDSLDAFMSNLSTSTLSKGDITKMKQELQDLRKEEIKLVKLINLAKPANLPPLVSHMLIEHKGDDLHQKSRYSKKSISQLEKRRQLAMKIQDNSDKIIPTCNNDTMDNEEEEEDEGNDKEEEKANIHISDNGDSFERNKMQKIRNTSVDKSECKNPALYKNKIGSTDSATIDLKSSNDSETSRIDATLTGDKKRKKDKKAEKISKNMKKYYDQDIHSEDYSTWVPPQGQCGDGRTSLNEKYGY